MTIQFFWFVNFLYAHIGWVLGAVAFVTVIGICCKAGSDEDDELGFDDLHGDYPRIPPEHNDRNAA